MFPRVPDASKTALAALVALCRANNVAFIDCQQKTSHLASLGAREMSRAAFLERVEQGLSLPAFDWKFSPVYWANLLPINKDRCDRP
jgi:leucyl/phenylalanyl-tRNA--protein transferase